MANNPRLLQKGSDCVKCLRACGKYRRQPQGSDIQGLSADLLEAARRRNLSANSLATPRGLHVFSRAANSTICFSPVSCGARE